MMMRIIKFNKNNKEIVRQKKCLIRYLANKYPISMDLGDDFYDKLFSEVSSRRKSNSEHYPSSDKFRQMLPKMGNIDAYQFNIYWNGVYGNLPNLPVDPQLLMKKFVDEADPDCVI